MARANREAPQIGTREISFFPAKHDVFSNRLKWFLVLFRSNDVDFGCNFAKWRDMNPRCAKLLEKQNLNPNRISCPVAVQT